MQNQKQAVASFIIVVLILFLTACSGTQTVPEPLVTPPAISVQITKDVCPSIEVQAGMQIVWTNKADVDRILIIERADEQGGMIDWGGTDLLKAGDSFSISLTEPGAYTYYCSEDRTAFATITVLPGSYPYP